MKIKNLKHNHSLTDLLKVLIFSILMLAPILAVAVKCAYVVVNKNAYQSYYGETINEKEYTSTTLETLQLNKQYNITNTITNVEYPFIAGNTEIAVENVYLNNQYKNITNIRVYVTNSNSNLYFQFIGTDSLIVTTNSVFEINFTFKGVNNYTYANEINNLLYKVTYNKYTYLDNVFYYAIDEMSENELFSWTKNTGIYTGVKAMTDNLQITTDVIAVLITYWTLLTVIYVIIDIVLKGFTLLTHMFQKESH